MFVPVHLPVPFVETHIGIDVLGGTGRSENLGIKTCIRIEEQTVDLYLGILKCCRDHLELYLYVIQVVMVARYGLRHGKGQSLPVGQVQRIGGLSALATLVLHAQSAP